uniref:Solute carrier family 30 member 6 n=1 Tax=Neolamprologus brichardi TaxID=32507 RepID=A0A3Q4GZ21_NEOBR
MAHSPVQPVSDSFKPHRSWTGLFRNYRCSGNIAYRCSKPPGTDRMSPKHQRFWILMSVLVCRVYIYLTVCVCVRLVCRFERLEVLAVFASTVLVQLGALFILKESVERFMEQPEVHTGRLLVGTFVALFFNLLTLLSVRNKPFAYVSEESQHLADVSSCVCAQGSTCVRGGEEVVGIIHDGSLFFGDLQSQSPTS